MDAVGVFSRFVMTSRTRAIVSIAVVGSLVIGTATAISATVLRPDAVQLYLEAADAVGPFPFAELTTPLRPLRRLLPSAKSRGVKDPATLDGTEVGLYGGSLQVGVCEPDKLVQFLTSDAAKGKAWAAALGIEPMAIASYVAKLTPVTLRTDIRVTNHGFRDGKPTPRQSILQAGTAVLVDDRGVPRVRCYCGNPLLPPQKIDGRVDYVGQRWADFDETRVYTITGGQPQEGFQLYDAERDATFFRRVGTAGTGDEVFVPRVVGEQADRAEELIKAAGLQASVTRRADTRVAGEVIDATPAASTRLAPGKSVALVVSAGPPGALPKPTSLSVPELGNRPLEEAVSTLQGLQLTVAATEREPSDTVPSGRVTRTEPGAGTVVGVGAAIRVFASSGPAERKVTVPQLVNLTYAAAERLLDDAGLRAAIVFRPDAAVPKDVVVVTDPPAQVSVSAGSAVTVVVSTGPETVTVPDLAGKSESEAAAALAAAGLQAQRAVEASESIRAGLVIRHVPAAGVAVSPNSVVTVVVSSGLPEATVPDVRGRNENDAKVVLGRERLQVSVVQQPSHTVPVGVVLGQTPAAGARVAIGTVVVVVVSKGPDPVPMCDAVGRTLDGARSACGEFTVRSTSRTDERVAVGVIISQSPAAGSAQLPGSTVDVVVSLGPAPRTVPELRGLNPRQANDAVSGMQLVYAQVNEFSDTVPAGGLIRQSPAPGTQVARGTTVTAVFSVGQDLVDVPNVVGSTVEDAASQLRNARLVLGRRTTANHPSVPVGRIISQTPASGNARAGSAVDVVVSAGPAEVCRSVVGLGENEAVGELRAVELSAAIRRENSTTVKIGVVIAQDPACAVRGSTITLRVSQGTVVPNLMERTEAVALQLLSNAGLRGTVSARECGGTPGTVTSQYPVAGMRVEPGTTVDFIVAQECRID